jgi:hypothetical protein
VLTRVVATRYVTPLREGGSLPGLMEADDLGTYVVKFRGAGQGRKALIAEVITGLLLRACGLRVPDLVTVELDPALAPGEPDQEIQDLLRASGGLNLGVDFLPGALDFDVASAGVDPATAGRILWLDALVANADRSWRNPNMLLWHGQLFLIDHGATLTFQHRWSGAAEAAERPYDASDHALIGCGGLVAEADAVLAPLITADLLAHVAAEVPDEWLAEETEFASADQTRQAYVGWLMARLQARPSWLPGLVAAAAAPSAGAGPKEGRAGVAGRSRAGRPSWLSRSPGAGPGSGAST